MSKNTPKCTRHESRSCYFKKEKPNRSLAEEGWDGTPPRDVEGVRALALYPGSCGAIVSPCSSHAADATLGVASGVSGGVWVGLKVGEPC